MRGLLDVGVIGERLMVADGQIVTAFHAYKCSAAFFDI